MPTSCSSLNNVASSIEKCMCTIREIQETKEPELPRLTLFIAKYNIVKCKHNYRPSKV